MTMTDRPAIPAELMDDQPLADDDLDALADALNTAGGPPLAELLERAAVPLAERPGEDLVGPVSRVPEAVTAFRVADDGTAEWALRKIAEGEARVAEVQAQAQGWRDEINRWEREQLRKPAAFRAFLEGHLVAYMRERVAEDPKLRTLSLPSGKVTATSRKPKVAIAENPEAVAALIAWADEHLEPEDLEKVVQTTRKPMVSELRKLAEVSILRVGTRWTVTLACGHAFRIFRDEGENEPAPPVQGERLACGSCPAEFGELLTQVVEHVVAEPVEEPVARDSDTGMPIPGAVVEPASWAYGVKVGGR